MTFSYISAWNLNVSIESALSMSELDANVKDKSSPHLEYSTWVSLLNMLEAHCEWFIFLIRYITHPCLPLHSTHFCEWTEAILCSVDSETEMRRKKRLEAYMAHKEEILRLEKKSPGKRGSFSDIWRAVTGEGWFAGLFFSFLDMRWWWGGWLCR